MRQKPSSRRIRNSTKSALRSPDPEHAKAAVFNAADAKRGFRHAIGEFVDRARATRRWRGGSAAAHRTCAGGSSSWQTPTSNAVNLMGAEAAEKERERRIARGGDTPSSCLAADAYLTSWGTPLTNDFTGGTEKRALNHQLKNQVLLVSGLTPSGSTAATERAARLDPAFSLWLMGFPEEWASCGAQVMPLSPPAAAKFVEAHKDFRRAYRLA